MIEQAFDDTSQVSLTFNVPPNDLKIGAPGRHGFTSIIDAW